MLVPRRVNDADGPVLRHIKLEPLEFGKLLG